MRWHVEAKLARLIEMLSRSRGTLPCAARMLACVIRRLVRLDGKLSCRSGLLWRLDEKLSCRGGTLSRLDARLRHPRETLTPFGACCCELQKSWRASLHAVVDCLEAGADFRKPATDCSKPAVDCANP